MQPIPTTQVHRTTARNLTIIAEDLYGSHRRLDLRVTPGMTAEDLMFDHSSFRLVQPGGGALAGTDDLFEVAADAPRIFALSVFPAPLDQSTPVRQHHLTLARLLSRSGRAMAAIILVPRARPGIAP